MILVLVPTCPLGFIFRISWDLCSLLSNERSLELYPCRFFSCRTIITLQQCREPEAQNRVISLAMVFIWQPGIRSLSPLTESDRVTELRSVSYQAVILPSVFNGSCKQLKRHTNANSWTEEKHGTFCINEKRRNSKFFQINQCLTKQTGLWCHCLPRLAFFPKQTWWLKVKPSFSGLKWFCSACNQVKHTFRCLWFSTFCAFPGFSSTDIPWDGRSHWTT